MNNISDAINEVMHSLSVTKWGVTSIVNLHPISEKFPTAVSIVMKYPEIKGSYEEEKLHNAINDTKEQLNNELKKLEEVLICLGVKYMIITEGQDEKTLLGKFPHKTAAVSAGHGWIGKNTLLITEEHGPRLRLATVLLDLEYDETIHEPIENKCDDCTLCINACPYNYLTGENWYRGMKRANMLNAFGCSKVREGYIKEIGHKHACGFCLLACPYGK